MHRAVSQNCAAGRCSDACTALQPGSAHKPVDHFLGFLRLVRIQLAVAVLVEPAEDHLLNLGRKLVNIDLARRWSGRLGGRADDGRGVVADAPAASPAASEEAEQAAAVALDDNLEE